MGHEFDFLAGGELESGTKLAQRQEGLKGKSSIRKSNIYLGIIRTLLNNRYTYTFGFHCKN